MTTSKKLWLGFSVLAILLILASLAIRADAVNTNDTTSREFEWIAALLLILGCGVAVVTTVTISRAIAKAERHVEDARTFADSIVETVREPLLVLDGELRVVRVNRAFYQTFKVTPAETGNSLLYKVGNGQWDILELRTLLEEILPQHTEVHGFEVVHVFEHIGKKTMLLNARRLVQATDQAPLILLAIEDITERKRLEDELHQVATEIHEYTASIVATVREPLLVLDADLRVQSASRSFYENFRVTPEGTENRLLYDLGNRQWDIPALRRLLEEVLPQENQVNDFSVEHEFEHIGKKTMLLNARRLIRATDQTPLILLAIEDITERSRLEDELRQIAAAMSEADRRKNEFLALLAHELRNPLAPIRSAVQLMQLTNDPEANKAATGIVERQVDQMVRLVDDLLDVSRISRGKIELRKQRIDLASIVKQAVEDTRPLVTSMGHELTVTIPPEPVFLNADRTRLIQVLGNLLNNACKFTDMGGRISLAVEVVGGDVVISVRDNGIGIAAAQLPSIFEMFVQADTSMERSVSGLGIGLALVKNMVEMHGGTVEVHSDGLGRGSTFVVRMAIMESPALAPALGAVDGGPDLATAQRILVVDDNVDAALMLERLLQLNGKQTRVAHSGPDALEVAEQFRPHLILLDIGLPKLNGYEVCRRIRRQPWGKDMVVIALTGWGQEEDRKRSKEAGFNAHFVKPLEREALMLVLAGKYPAAA
ncbi:MAG: response regulator [Flavobacteriales bacterium]|nr:response regulator [Flavobacteriales bacterium]MBK7752816.1 response regulator [Flavobacteriales bacterium]MBK9539030.1 response regulator [Flavobacteriales bacterium]